MALHKNFPKSPHEILDPSIRWFPGEAELFSHGYEKLLPPLVAKLRKEVQRWRESGYNGASETSKALLVWWFETEHLLPVSFGESLFFQYYFAQREAVETVIYLFEIEEARTPYDLMKFDSSGAVSENMFDENWTRFVIKMATGSGKTKVLSLLLAWSFFHKSYEEESELSRNFLVIAPNIIVLDRIRADFDGLKIFFEDPVIPDNGFEGRNWRDDFQLQLHIQDNVNITQKTGNIFLTNIHRVFESGDKIATATDANTMNYFLGEKAVLKTSDSKVDLDEIVRNIDELMILNDEAHHIHDANLAWFKSIEDIHNRLLQKGKKLSLQLDVTATPKHNKGAIFVQTVSDYPLVEAIAQDVVKHPVVPDEASRVKLSEKQSSKFTEKYRDYIHLGFLEWQKAFIEHKKMNKKAVLFIMTDDTKNCDELAQYLEETYIELKDAVLTIHTQRNGELYSASSGKNKEELEKLRVEANEIDSNTSPYKAIVSVLMLKEGWDVKNVTTIVGLRSYSSKSNILPEQTLGRGLRRMYRNEDVEEIVSVVGTDAFLDFVESIKVDGVELEHKAMGGTSGPKTPIIIEVDKEKDKKLDISLPVSSPRIFREYKNISEIDISKIIKTKFKIKKFSEQELKELIFKDITTEEYSHTTVFRDFVPDDYRSVVGFFANTIKKAMRLVGGYDVLYEKLKEFITEELFEERVEIADKNILRNLSELPIRKAITDGFKKQINELTVSDRGETKISGEIKLRDCKPFVSRAKKYIIPKKSLFGKIIGDSDLELDFAAFLENCDDIISYAKNYFAIGFKIDYQNSNGDISNYYPDFIVKKSEKEIFIIETKGREEIDVPEKMKRLKNWCKDMNTLQNEKGFDYVFVDEESFKSENPKSFGNLAKAFRKYKD